RRVESVEYKALSVSVYYWDELLRDLERDAKLEPLRKKVLEEDGSCTGYTMEEGRLLYKNRNEKGYSKDGFKVCVVVDRLSKYAHFVPLRHPYPTSTVVVIFMREVLCLHGVPKAMVTDRDKAEYWYNTSYHTSSKATPFKILYGRDPPKIIPYETSSAPTFEVDKYLEERDRVLDDLRNMKAQSDNHRIDVQFLVGDMVFLKLKPYRQRSEVLGVRGGKSNSKEYREVPIRWKSLAEYESTWEPFQLIQNQFPDFHLEDKVLLWEWGIDMNTSQR
ncbi:putative mitochondrial protein, partial [Tanacetum coccineum]